MSKNWGKVPCWETKLEIERKKYKYICSHCGWFNIIYPFEKKDKKICRNCGYYVYNSDKAKFKDKLKEVIKNDETI